MKTAISIPDITFLEVERCAQELGISRSEFFAQAARHYLTALEAQGLTARVNEALDRIEADDSNAFAAAMGQAMLASGDAEW